MAVELQFDLDCTDMDETSLETGGRVPAGWHRFRVKDVYTDPKFGSLVIDCEISGGRYSGLKQREMLWDPAQADDDKKATTSKRHMALWAKRLGLISAEQLGKPLTINWLNLIGREGYMQVQERTYTKNGVEYTASEARFDGVYGLTDERVPDQVKRDGWGPPTVAAVKPAKAGAANGWHASATETPMMPAMAGAGAPNIDDF